MTGDALYVALASEQSAQRMAWASTKATQVNVGGRRAEANVNVYVYAYVYVYVCGYSCMLFALVRGDGRSIKIYKVLRFEASKIAFSSSNFSCPFR